jgi:hypothetical protein
VRRARYCLIMTEEFRVCAGCGRPIAEGEEHVTAEPMMPMHDAGETVVLVAGAPQPFHPQHVPAGARWRVRTSSVDA